MKKLSVWVLEEWIHWGAQSMYWRTSSAFLTREEAWLRLREVRSQMISGRRHWWRVVKYVSSKQQ